MINLMTALTLMFLTPDLCPKKSPCTTIQYYGKVDSWGYVYISKNQEYLDKYVDQPWFFILRDDNDK